MPSLTLFDYIRNDKYLKYYVGGIVAVIIVCIIVLIISLSTGEPTTSKYVTLGFYVLLLHSVLGAYFIYRPQNTVSSAFNQTKFNALKNL